MSIGENMDDALSNIFKQHDINYQVEEAHKILKSQWDSIDSEYIKSLCIMCKLNDSYINNKINNF